MKKALLNEAPAGSGRYLFKLVGRDATIAGPLAPGEVMRLRPEIAAGVCVEQVLATCASTPAKDTCTP